MLTLLLFEDSYNIIVWTFGTVVQKFCVDIEIHKFQSWRVNLETSFLLVEFTIFVLKRTNIFPTKPWALLI